MLAALNEFHHKMTDGSVWRFRANQLAYCELERISGLPLSLALNPKYVADPVNPKKSHVDNRTQLRLLYVLSASHRAREGLNVRFDFDPDRDTKDGYRGPFFVELINTTDLFALANKATQAVRADFGHAAELEEAEGDEGNGPTPSDDT